MSVAADIQRILLHLNQRSTQLLTLLVAETDAQLKMRSPVDTGRFRASWTIAVGQPDTHVQPPVAPGQTIAQPAPQIPALAIGQVVYLTNALPYARALEYGSSAQAPQGMVRLTALETPQRVQALVRALGQGG